MQLSDRPRKKNYPANSPHKFFFYYYYYYYYNIKKMQYGKTSYARQDQPTFSVFPNKHLQSSPNKIGGKSKVPLVPRLQI
jgi:hypothetical protein